jgi:hypothetical protein
VPQVGEPGRPSGKRKAHATRTQSPRSGDPFGFARCLRRETLPQHWSHLLQRCLTRYLRRETLSVCVAPPMPAARLRLSGLVATTGLTRRQIPSEGNPPAVLAPQGTTLGSTGSPQHWLLLHPYTLTPLHPFKLKVKYDAQRSPKSSELSLNRGLY